MRGVGGVRKSIHQSWLAKGLGLLCWGFKGVQEEIPREEASTLQIGQWHFYQDNAPIYDCFLVTDYLTKLRIKTVCHPPYSPDLAPCDFWLFPKLEAVIMRQLRIWKRLWRRWLTCSRKSTSMDLSEVVGTVQQAHCSRKRLLWRGLQFHVRTINKSVHMEKVWKLI